MEKVVSNTEEITINSEKEFKFKSAPGFYLITITARAKGKKQISPNTTDDEDLIISIDNRKYPYLSSPDRLIDSPAAFSGGSLHGSSKTVYFITSLAGENHSIILSTDGPSKTATLEKLEAYILDIDQTLDLEIKNKAEDGDRRSWITFVFDQLALESFTPTITYGRKHFDSDDVKIIFDGKTFTNLLKTVKYFFWKYAGFLTFQSTKTETETFTVKAASGLHYLEFIADRTPILEKIRFVFKPTQEQKITPYINPPGRDYNQIDKDILYAANFWNEFFAKQAYPPPIPLDPNLVKAIIYRESRLGYFPDDKIIDVMQVWDPENPARDALLGKTIANEFVSSSKIGHIEYSYPDFAKVPKVESRKESIFWGVRWLYYKAQYLHIDKKGVITIPYVREWQDWKTAIKLYNGNPEISDAYIKEVYSIYEKGTDSEGNHLW